MNHLINWTLADIHDEVLSTVFHDGKIDKLCVDAMDHDMANLTKFCVPYHTTT